VIRTTNLLERLFLEERRRTKIIPHAFGERPVLKLMYAAVIRAADRWRGITVGELEQRQLRAIRDELNRAHATRTAPAVTAPKPASCASEPVEELCWACGGRPASRRQHAVRQFPAPKWATLFISWCLTGQSDCSGTAGLGRARSLRRQNAMRDDQHSTGPCRDGSHRVLNMTLPYAKAQVVRAQLICALGATRVSRLRRAEDGWEIVICRQCIKRQHGELAG
jgi:hypothetical protein